MDTLPFPANDGGAYVSETSTAVLSLEKCLAVCCKSGASEALAGNAVGKAVVHHLLRQPAEVARVLLQRAFDVATRDVVCGDVVPFVARIAAGGSRRQQPPRDAFSELSLSPEDPTEAGAAQPLVPAEVFDKLFEGLAAGLRAGEGDRDAVLASVLCLGGLAAVGEPRVAAALLGRIRRLREIATAAATTNKRGFKRPTKLGLAAAETVFRIASSAASSYLSSVAAGGGGGGRIVESNDEALLAEVWNLATPVGEMLGTLEQWYDGFNGVLSAAARCVKGRMEALSALRGHQQQASHNAARMGLPAADLTAIHLAFASTVASCLGFVTAGQSVTQGKKSKFSLPTTLCRIASEEDHSNREKQSGAGYEWALKIAFCIGGATRLELGELLDEHREVAKLVATTAIAKLAAADRQDEGCTEAVPGDSKRVVDSCAASLEAMARGGKQGSALLGCSVTDVLSLFRLSPSCAAVAELLVRTLPYSRTVFSELLRLAPASPAAMRAMKDLLLLGRQQGTPPADEAAVASLVVAAVQSPPGQDELAAAAAELAPLLPLPATVPRLLRAAAARPPRPSALRALAAVARSRAASAEFPVLLAATLLDHFRAEGTSFEPGGTPLDPLAPPVPENPGDIGAGPGPKEAAAGGAPDRQSLLAVGKKAAVAWAEGAAEPGRDWAAVIPAVYDIVFLHPSEDVSVALCSVICPTAFVAGCPFDVLAAPIVDKLASNAGNTEQPSVFVALAPLLLLSPMPPPFFWEASAVPSSSSVTRSTLCDSVLQTCLEADVPLEARRLGWEIASRFRPVSLFLPKIIHKERPWGADDLKHRLLCICKAASFALACDAATFGQTYSAEEVLQLKDAAFVLRRTEPDSMPKEAVATTTLAFRDAMALCLAACARCSASVSLDDFTADVLLSAVAYLRKSPSGLPAAFLAAAIENAISRMIAQPEAATELLFNLVYSATPESLSPHVCELGLLAVQQVASHQPPAQRGNGLKLLGSLLAKTPDFFVRLPEDQLHQTVAALSSMASSPESVGRQTSQLAGQLLQAFMGS
ncbi:hypothetical protein DIPPA_04495 [Diplonema papillatum]|nr:hypothetical protein DIPPA_04495 [Diplonema papillatum]|eukprot:gene685-1046_t